MTVLNGGFLNGRFGLGGFNNWPSNRNNGLVPVGSAVILTVLLVSGVFGSSLEMTSVSGLIPKHKIAAVCKCPLPY